MTVLVVTAADDDTSTRVCDALDDRSRPFARVDLGDFPETLSVTAAGPESGWCGTLRVGDQELRLADVEAVYWRRPTAFRFPAGMDAQHRRFAAAEARQGLGGLVTGLPVPIVNHPSRIADAELKPVQLQAAAQLGFRVPPTLITTDPAAAREFVRCHRRVLYKPFSAAFLRSDDSVRLVYATVVDDHDLLDPDSVAQAPCQFQAFVDKTHDVRLVAVGGQRFAVAIHAGSDASHIDWRADYPSLRYETVDVPGPVDDAVTAYLDRFGLVFGCFDFTVDHEGWWWFLEFTDRPVLRTSRSWRPVSGVPADRLPARSGTSVLFRWLDGACGADGVGRGSEGSGDHPRQGLAVVDGAVARGCSARAGRSVPAAA